VVLFFFLGPVFRSYSPDKSTGKLLSSNALTNKRSIVHTLNKKKNFGSLKRKSSQSCEQLPRTACGTGSPGSDRASSYLRSFDLKMNSQAEGRARGFVDGLAQRRMRMNRCFNLFKGCFERDGQTKLSN